MYIDLPDGFAELIERLDPQFVPSKEPQKPFSDDQQRKKSETPETVKELAKQPAKTRDENRIILEAKIQKAKQMIKILQARLEDMFQAHIESLEQQGDENKNEEEAPPKPIDMATPEKIVGALTTMNLSEEA